MRRAALSVVFAALFLGTFAAVAEPESTLDWRMTPRSSAAAPGGCCKVCTVGKPCGDTCISVRDSCNVGPGCACSATDSDSSLKAAVLPLGSSKAR